MAEHEAHKSENDATKSASIKVAKVDEAPADEPVLVSSDQDVVDHAREVLKKEAEGMDETDGPADNFTGDASEDPSDHFLSSDPYKRAFPPGPDDPTKL